MTSKCTPSASPVPCSATYWRPRHSAHWCCQREEGHDGEHRDIDGKWNQVDYATPPTKPREPSVKLSECERCGWTHSADAKCLVTWKERAQIAEKDLDAIAEALGLVDDYAEGQGPRYGSGSQILDRLDGQRMGQESPEKAREAERAAVLRFLRMLAETAMKGVASYSECEAACFALENAADGINRGQHTEQPTVSILPTIGATETASCGHRTSAGSAPCISAPDHDGLHDNGLASSEARRACPDCKATGSCARHPDRLHSSSPAQPSSDAQAHADAHLRARGMDPHRVEPRTANPILDFDAHAEQWLDENATSIAFGDAAGAHEAIVASLASLLRQAFESGEAHAQPMADVKPVEVFIADPYGDGSAWKLFINGFGCAAWPCGHDARAYAEEVARVIRTALTHAGVTCRDPREPTPQEKDKP